MTFPCCASGSYTVGFRFGFYCVVIFHYLTFLATFSPPLSGSTGAECADDSIHHNCGDLCTFPGGRVVEQALKPFIDLFGSLTILGNLESHQGLLSKDFIGTPFAPVISPGLLL